MEEDEPTLSRKVTRETNKKPMGTSRKAKYEGVYAGQWTKVMVDSTIFSSDCFSILSKVKSKIIK